MTLTNSQPHIEPVWVQNLKGFINGVFPADDTWKRIFVDQLDGAARRVDELEQENARIQTRREYVLGTERAMETASAHAIARHETAKRLKAEVKYEAEIERLRREVQRYRDLALEEAAELHEREAARYGGGKRWAKKIGWHQAMAEMIRALKGDHA